MEAHPEVTWTIVVASALMFVISLLAMPPIVARIRADYFAHETRPATVWEHRHPALRLALLVGKNILGYVLIAAGIAMLVLPGQGLLTIVAGFLIVDFPGKYALEKWVVRRPWVRRPVNWLRRRRGVPDLQLEPPRDPATATERAVSDERSRTTPTD